MAFETTLNERDKIRDSNLIDYQGVFIIPTLHMIEVPKTNIIENMSKNNRMLDSTFFADTLSVPRPQKMTLDNKILKLEWSKERSIFRNYVLDKESTIKKWFEIDWENWEMNKIIKDEFDRGKVKEYLRTIYPVMREAYKYYSGISFANNVPAIGVNTMIDLLTTAGVLDHKLLKISDISIDFIATNVWVKNPDPKLRYLNPERMLIRHDFMEIFVRLAGSKYLKIKKLLTYHDAVRQIFKDGLLSHMASFDSNDFRLNLLYTESWDMVFKYYLKAVKALYFHYSGKHWKPHESRFMCNDEFSKLFFDSGIISDLFNSKELGIIFNLSMMTQLDEISQELHFRMTFDEFIEAIARVADKWNLLLVSSSYFGVDLDRELEKERAGQEFGDNQQTLIPDDTTKSIFNPSNVIRAKNGYSKLSEERKQRDALVILNSKKMLFELDNEWSV
jgi:hypothetical protein